MSGMSAYRYHLIATLSRGIFVNLGWLFAGSFFISQYGGEFYAPLHLIASVLTMACYLIFMWLSVRGSQVTYLAAFSGAALLTCGQWMGLQHEVVALGFCSGILLIDLVGATISGNLLQAAVNPSIFKRIYQKIISTELLTRFICTCAFFVVSKFDVLSVCFPVMTAAAVVHVFAMMKIRQQLPIADHDPAESRVKNVLGAAKFVKENPLVKLALLITVWTYTMKFLGENLYYQAVETRFASQNEVGVFMSQLSFGLILFSLVFKKVIGDRLVDYRTPSQLFFVLPAGIIVTLCVALLAPPFWPVIGMYVFFMSINRGLQLPVSRQCLVPVPDAQKHAIVTLIFLISGAASIAVSGALTMLKGQLESQHYVYLMIGLTLPIFIPLLNVDTLYVRNLWSMYRERIRGLWVEDIWQSPSLALRSKFRRYYDVYDEDFWIAKGGGRMEQRASLVAGYQSENPDVLRKTVLAHKGMLESSDALEVQEGIAVICEVGLPYMQKTLHRYVDHPDLEVSRLAETELRVCELMECYNTEGLRSHSKRKLKALMHLAIGSENEEDRIRRLDYLLNNPDRKVVAKILDALNFCVSELEQSELCWKILDKDGLTLMPLIEEMLQKSYPRAAGIRELFLLTDLREILDNELEASVATILTELTTKYFSVWTRKSSEIQWQSRFQHALFLEEFRLRKSSASDAVIDSIDGIFECSYEDKLVLCNMHQEVLKKSQFHFAWTTILDPEFYMQRTQFKDRTVRKFRLIESITPRLKSRPPLPTGTDSNLAPINPENSKK